MLNTSIVVCKYKHNNKLDNKFRCYRHQYYGC